MKFKKFINGLARTLVIVGALNWGLALFNVNLVQALFVSMPMVMKLVYGLVGLSGVWELIRAINRS